MYDKENFQGLEGIAGWKKEPQKAFQRGTEEKLGTSRVSEEVHNPTPFSATINIDQAGAAGG